tara:strand:- start:265 stop:417 length:153 start_codon:yes stop_codon:yes gene_type:complete
MSQEPVLFEELQDEVQRELKFPQLAAETEVSQSADKPYSQGSGDSGCNFR